MLSFEPLDPRDIADEEVRADAADVGDEKAAVGDWVDVRHHVVAQVLIPVAPLAAAKTILEYQWDQEHLWTQPCELGYSILPVRVDTVVEERVTLGDLWQLERRSVPQVGLKLDPGKKGFIFV